MRLVHFSNKPLNLLAKGVDYGVPRDGYEYFKPHGLWVSDEDDYGWKSWCQAEEFSLDRLKLATEVNLKDDANILYLRTPDELDAFTKKYPASLGLNPELDMRYVDWPKVMSLYDGVIITPYQWSRRLELMWYYSWDCASGCIWNIGVIDKVAPITGEEYDKLVARESEDA